MAHLLIIELPGGNDFDLVQAAVDRGDRFTFLTSDLQHYKKQDAAWALLEQAQRLLEVPDFAFEPVTQAVLKVHAHLPINAVLCLLDIRLVEAACLAELLECKHIKAADAVQLRDKYSVRRTLAEAGIAQPDFALARSNADLKQVVEQLGLPLLIKPSDGYASQNIAVLRYPEDLDPLWSPLEDMLPSHADYGLGVRANDRLVVERLLEGTVIGCDTLSVDGHHRLLGIHEKLFFEAPSFAIQGSCFATDHPQWDAIESYVLSILDILHFSCGATHTELMLTADGPRLIEVNGRMVGAKIARLANYALDWSFHSAVIDMHLGHVPEMPVSRAQPVFAVTRWIVAENVGVLEQVCLSIVSDPRIRCVEMMKQAGDAVRPPIENADRIGYVMVCANTRAAAETLAEQFVAQAVVILQPTGAHAPQQPEVAPEQDTWKEAA
jgi:biotin carboxylase